MKSVNFRFDNENNEGEESVCERASCAISEEKKRMSMRAFKTLRRIAVKPIND